MNLRVALYARYSSDSQRDASIEDQFRLCRARVERDKWTVVEAYSDRAVSGATLSRPGIQQLLRDAEKRRFDVVLAEGLDRISRDQEDIAHVYKVLRFHAVQIVTLSEDKINELHIGLKGTMNAMFLTSLAGMTFRGLVGAIEDGRSAGGRCYGYEVVRTTDDGSLLRDKAGEPLNGMLRIKADEAAVVRRIMSDYADGASPLAIARALNAEKQPGPRAPAWGPSTIQGNTSRGTGILNNTLYIGRRIWNRQHFARHPITDSWVAQANDVADHIEVDVPDLRIVDDELWTRVRERQRSLQRPRTCAGTTVAETRRPTYLLSGLIKCGCCGGGYSMISKDLMGCSTRHNKRTCGNALNIRRDKLEAAVLSGLRKQLMQPALLKEFCDEFTREMKRLRLEAGASNASDKAALTKVEQEIRSMVEAIKAGMFQPAMKAEMDTLEARKAELTRKLETAAEPPPLLHPRLARPLPREG